MSAAKQGAVKERKAGAPSQAVQGPAKYDLIGRIAAGLAHELNGPIGISLGFTELAKEILAEAGDAPLKPDSVAKVREYLDLVESAGLRARALSRQMWGFAKSDPGQVEEIDLAEAIQEAAGLSGPALKVAQIEVARRSTDGFKAPVQADRVLCVQSFVHLFLASTSALPAGGSVFWEATPQADGSARFALTAEPWGDSPSAEWPVEEPVRLAFANQGGEVDRAVRRTITRPDAESGRPPSSPGWEVSGRLPGAPGS